MHTGTEARAHHFVPQCYLAGFTDTGRKDGRLHVTDLKRQKQWVSNPVESAHRRDYNRLSQSDFDPLLIEKKLAEIEGAIAPVFKTLDEELRPPTREELDYLLAYMAIQWVRVPAFRSLAERITDTIYRSKLDEAVKTPESWTDHLEKSGIPLDSPGADYERAFAFQKTGAYTFSVENDWHLKKAFQTAANMIPALENRYWNTYVSFAGDYITSDNPVAIDGEKDTMVGFMNAEIITFPVSRHLMLIGTLEPCMVTPYSDELVAQYNTFYMITAPEQLYAHRADFPWMDENGIVQRDWSRFDKAKVTA
ncbi:MAG TPA: DUF4238 domain-containing protein [Edaphobacter sp.]|nr:DUF4238 domain-containing protein [Edaphobacter sp.]